MSLVNRFAPAPKKLQANAHLSKWAVSLLKDLAAACVDVKKHQRSQSWNVSWNQSFKADVLEMCENASAVEGGMSHEINQLGRKSPKNKRKKHPPAKAGMSHGMNDLSQKWGLDPKLECPLESIKQGLHRNRQSCDFLQKCA